MKIGKRIYFGTPQERKEFTALVSDAVDVIEVAQRISKTYGKDLTEAMEIAQVYNDFMRKEK